MKWRYLIVLAAPAFTSCEAAKNLVFEPEVTDPLDGYEGSLAQAGINTDMDWGPKQGLLLSKYKTLLETNNNLMKEHEDVVATNQNLQAQLTGEQAALATEKSQRAQAETETERLRQRIRERDAKILSLSIEKAKLEQNHLRSQIAALDESMDTGAAGMTEATAKPGRRQ